VGGGEPRCRGVKGKEHNNTNGEEEDNDKKERYKKIVKNKTNQLGHDKRLTIGLSDGGGEGEASPWERSKQILLMGMFSIPNRNLVVKQMQRWQGNRINSALILGKGKRRYMENNPKWSRRGHVWNKKVHGGKKRTPKRQNNDQKKKPTPQNEKKKTEKRTTKKKHPRGYAYRKGTLSGRRGGEN